MLNRKHEETVKCKCGSSFMRSTAADAVRARVTNLTDDRKVSCETVSSHCSKN